MSGTRTHAPARLDAWEGASVASWQDRWGLPELACYASVGSTNDVARAIAEAGAAHGATVIAEAQTAGRGRGVRAWHSPADSGLWVSIVLRPTLRADSAPGTLPLRIGLAVANAIARTTGVEPRIKWPNDLIVRDRKLAGILCEAALDARGGFVVAGIGVNVHQRREDWPEELRDDAISIAEAAGRDVSRAELTGEIVQAVASVGRSVSPLEAGELGALQRLDALRGQPVTVDGSPAGTAAGIAPDGALLIDSVEGRRTVRSGTVRIHQ